MHSRFPKKHLLPFLVFILTSPGLCGDGPWLKFEDIWYQVEDDEVIILEHEGETDILEIPAEIDGYPVTTIHEAALGGTGVREEIILPDTVTTLAPKAFWQSTVRRITLPEGLKTISTSAFIRCRNLVEIHLPDSLETIESWAFNGCSSLEDLDIPEGVKRIGNAAFIGCTSLQRMRIPASVEFVGMQAFNRCTQLEEIIVAEENAHYQVVEGALLNTSGEDFLQYFLGSPASRYSVPASVKDIHTGAFAEASNLEEVIIQGSPDFLRSETFMDCENLRKVVLPSSLRLITNSAFANCTSLENFTFPSSLRKIEERAFRNCTSLTEVVLPEGLTTMEAGVFEDCSGLERVQLPSTLMCPESGEAMVAPSTFLNCTGLVRVDLAPEIAVIGESAFENCASLAEVPLPAALHTIENHAFRNCTSLTEVVLPEGLTTMEAGVFEDCSGLERVQLPSTLMCPESGEAMVAPSTFLNCTGLVRVDLAPEIAVIGESAFENCASLAGVSLPAALHTIEEHAFRNCTSLTEVVLPEGLATMGWGVFQGCSGLQFAELPASLSTIPFSTFSNCTNLSKVRIAPGLTSIRSRAFRNCHQLTDLSLPDGIQSIYDSAFQNCDGLTKIRLPDTLTYLGEMVFADCSNLVSADLSSGLTEIRKATFAGCDQLKDLQLPEFLEKLDSRAIDGCSRLEEVFLPKSLEKIVDSRPAIIRRGSLANKYFSGCANLRKIEVHPDNSAFSSTSGVLYNKEKTQLLRCPPGKRDFDGRLLRSVRTIRGFAFLDCLFLYQLKIPEPVESIGGAGFAGCNNLSWVILPKTLTDLPLFGFLSSPVTAYTLPNREQVTNFSLAETTPSLIFLFDIDEDPIDFSNWINPENYPALYYSKEAKGWADQIGEWPASPIRTGNLYELFAGVAFDPSGWAWTGPFGWVEDHDDHWIRHLEHGFLRRQRGETILTGLTFYDAATGALFWTNETHYPYVYKYHRNAGWYWYVEGGSPGNREFIRYADGLLFTEDEWNE